MPLGIVETFVINLLIHHIMLHTILIIAGLVIMAVNVVALFTILGVLTDKDRDQNTTLLFSKLDRINLYLQGLRDKVGTMPDAQSVGTWMQGREKASAQLLAAIVECKESVEGTRQLLDLIAKSGYAEYLPKIDETLRAADGRLQNIADFADCGRQYLAVLRDLANERATQPDTMPEELIDEPKEESQEEKPVGKKSSKKALAGKSLTIAEKFDRMKQRLEEGTDWKAIAKEFGYNRPRDARRFYERHQAKLTKEGDFPTTTTRDQE